MNPSTHNTGERPDLFVTTRWTVVVAAGGRNDQHAEVALQQLCQTYWYPLYVYVRRQGQSHEDAQDLTQEFFARLLAGTYLEGLDAAKGRFRAFLLAAMKHFLANEWNRSRAQKRGGGAVHLALDWQSADATYRGMPCDELSPDKLYDRAWSVTLLERVLARLREEAVAEGKATVFDALKDALMGAGGSHAEVALQLGYSEGAVRVAVHRLRKRYRQLLRDEIAQTLVYGEQIEEENRALAQAFR